MLKRLRRIAVTAAVLVSVVIPLAPSPAAAASNLVYPSELGRWWVGGPLQPGTGWVNMLNSSGQKIGEYQLTARHYHVTDGSEYAFEMKVCVKDTLANGRGVIARVLLKFGSSSSEEVIKRKDSGGSCSDTLYPSNPNPVWAVDVDTGETWSGVPYQYTGHYDRYANIVSIYAQNVSFDRCDTDHPTICGAP
jgi:hypothetical protein